MEATSDEMISSEEWISLSGFYTTEEEAEFMTQFLGNCIVQQDVYGGSSSSNTNLNLGMIPSSSSSSSAFWPSGIISSSSSESLYLLPSNVADDDGGGGDNAANCNEFASMMSMGFPCSVVHHHSNEQSSVQMMNEAIDEDESVKEVVSEPEREVKRSRSSIEMSKNKRNVKSKKNSNSSSCSSYCSSEDDSSASQEAIHGGSSSCLSPQNNNTTLKSNGKSRSNRGPATDPQSVYARRRRERINERLRILQNLVPNGTKVDISTMLEEAVQYVKFLQLQIKLLSSDDMWMYAPIAYNGMNIGLDLNITPTKQP